jgi:ribosomal protein S13
MDVREWEQQCVTQETGTGDAMHAGHRFRRPLVVRGQATERATTPRRGSRMTPFVASGRRTTASSLPRASASSGGSSPVSP